MKLIPAFCLSTVLVLGMMSCGHRESPRMTAFPRWMLWAWEEPQDLRFLKGQAYGVAFYAKHVVLRGTGMEVRPRATPLKVDESTPLMAVVRIDGHSREIPILDERQLNALIVEVEDVIRLPRVRGLQLDFDARHSERLFYIRLVNALRAAHPNLALSITALASWCVEDPWIRNLPVDEAVPMLFRMGTNAEGIRAQVREARNFQAEIANHALGISTDEPRDMVPPSWRKTRRIYIFQGRPWTADQVAHLTQELIR